MTFFKAIIVFLAAIATDVTWAKYTIHTSKHRAWRSALWSVGIVLVGAVSIYAIAHSPWYVIPSALGAFVGTYFTVRHSKRSDERP